MITVGLDIGSITAKAALVADGRLAGHLVMPTGYDARAAGERVYDTLLRTLQVSVGDVERVISTGYGRETVSFAAETVTEIICHGVGARYLEPAVCTVIDVGGQDSKALRLDAGGRVVDFLMNDKCAAGTGRFLEVMARALEVELESLGKLARQSRQPAAISSTCTVFAESEVVSLIAGGAGRPDIVAGIHEAVAARVSSLVQRIRGRAPFMMTGGVAHNAGVVRALEKRLGAPVAVHELAQVNGALGAALLAAGRAGAAAPGGVH